MQRIQSHDPALDAWVETPDEWLSGDYDTYLRAYTGADAEGHAPPTCQLAGVVALIIKGRVRAAVPGLDLAAQPPDLTQVGAKAMGFLLRAVADPLEATQIVPFGSSGRSETGTRVKVRRSRGRAGT